jgi:MoaA/NifB/PqqE/SkfB family radical SAM enzyme
MSSAPDRENMLWKEEIANRPKHWVRLVTACNSKCLFCLDMDTPRNVYLEVEDIKADLRKGREELDAWKVILSGGEATLHPEFPSIIEYAYEIGYGRVQTVTNGYRFGQDRKFLKECLDAGLAEITFSLHGHTEELHDHLTQHPGSFKNLLRGLIRAKRDGRPIVNVDVVINKQNVGHLDKIVELSASLGVFEFDLLHVIPQAEAYRKRDELFYNPREHLETLHKVFKLNRHPRFVIWTNRFPVPFLEGMEDLIQDPHKMLDEVNGRRFHVRRYLDRGEPLECREQERCIHCFIEPFCTTLDRSIEAQNTESWQVWWCGEEHPASAEALIDPLPYGCSQLGLAIESLAAIETLPRRAGVGFYLRVAQAEALDGVLFPSDAQHTLVAESSAHLEAWCAEQPPANVSIAIELNESTALFVVANQQRLAAYGDQISIHQRTHEHMREAADKDIRKPRSFFEQLEHPFRVSGLPACIVPNMRLEEQTRVLRPSMFETDTGRFNIRALSRYHIREGYYAKSSRCADCRVTDRCDGMHVNMIRAQGLGMLDPLKEGDWAEESERQLRALYPEVPLRISTGKPKEPVAESLPGFGQAPEPPEDPLVIEQRRLEEKRDARRAKVKDMWAEKQKNAVSELCEKIEGLIASAASGERDAGSAHQEFEALSGQSAELLEQLTDSCAGARQELRSGVQQQSGLATSVDEELLKGLVTVSDATLESLFLEHSKSLLPIAKRQREYERGIENLAVAIAKLRVSFGERDALDPGGEPPTQS